MIYWIKLSKRIAKNATNISFYLFLYTLQVDNDEYVKKVLTGDMSAPAEKSSKERPEKSEKREHREKSADRRKRVCKTDENV